MAQSAQDLAKTTGFVDVGTPVALVRPANVARSLFHVACGATALTLLCVLPSRGWLVLAAGAFAVSAWTMEISRRRSPAVNDRLMGMFGAVAHPHERYRVNSATWYATALAFLALFAPLGAAQLGVLVLGVADPAAGFIGRRFGRLALVKNRTLEGTLTFVGMGASAAFLWLLLTTSASTGVLVLTAVTAGLSGALAELLTGRFDDNFTIPVATTIAVACVQLVI